MLNLILRQVKKRWLWARSGPALSRVRSTAEFDALVARVAPADFLHYRDASREKRADFRAVVDTLGLDLRGKAVLDVGPGYGDALDVAHEAGASQVDFVEYDPFFFAHNRLKGYTRGFRLNHLVALQRVPSSAYDLVWVKGAIAADLFIVGRPFVSLERWMARLEGRARPGGHVVVCPYWSTSGGARRFRDVESTSFAGTMRARGYRRLAPIPGHNVEPIYPVTYVRQV